tara:strand:+ start:1792 stop:2076 length:285 start_codon:yes stop_codon:yes gene_type:complete
MNQRLIRSINSEKWGDGLEEWRKNKESILVESVFVWDKKLNVLNYVWIFCILNINNIPIKVISLLTKSEYYENERNICDFLKNNKDKWKKHSTM